MRKRTLNVEIPEKLGFLFQPCRYKGSKGGRGSAKSWSFARALLALGRAKRIRILCAREVQKSIKDSVHQLLKDQISMMGLTSHYQVLNTEIRGRNGTQILFTGLSEHTVDTIKSFEGVDICWVEEAQAVSKKSWDILIPTIRRDNSEIWFSYNPDLETDETHQRFVIKPPPDCIVVHMNWRDNPWFNDTLNRERLHCQRTQPDDYDNIWEGACRPAVQGAIYYKEIQAAEKEGRICRVPYDPMLSVHVVMDIGWNDDMTISMVQRHLSEIRVIDYIEDNQRTLDWYSAELKERRYNWGQLWLPYADGFTNSVQTGKSCEKIFKSLGWKVVPKDRIANLSVEDGIRHARMAFPRTYFDAEKCAPLIEHLKRYRRSINRTTNTAGAPLHDDHSHGADCYRYVAINAEQMRYQGAGIPPPIPEWKKRLMHGNSSGPSAQAA